MQVQVELTSDEVYLILEALEMLRSDCVKNNFNDTADKLTQIGDRFEPYIS